MRQLQLVGGGTAGLHRALQHKAAKNITAAAATANATAAAATGPLFSHRPSRINRPNCCRPLGGHAISLVIQLMSIQRLVLRP